MQHSEGDPITNDEASLKQVIFSRDVFPVFFTTFGNMLASRLVEQTLLLFMIQAKLIEDQTASFYVITKAMYLLVPIVAAVLLGDMAVRIGTGPAFAVCHVIIAVGIFTMAVSRGNHITFFIGYTLFAFFAALRVLRFTLVGQMVPPRHRTFTLAALQATVPVAMTMGPMLWLLFQSWRGEVKIFPPYLVADRFLLTQSTAFVITIALALMAYFVLRTPSRAVSPVALQHSDNSVPSYDATAQSGSSNLPPPTEQEVNRYKRSRFIFFAILIICTNFSFDVLFVSFQPILITYFNSTDAEVGEIYGGAGLVAFLPPIMMAILSTRISDRAILSGGIIMKAVAALLYLPVFGTIYRPQVVAGHYLNMASALLVNTPFISLFTKVLGKLFSGRAIGNLWSCSNVLAAFVQLTFSSQIVGLFGFWSYSVFVFPVVIALTLVFSPFGIRMLDDQSEETIRMTT